MQIHNVFPRLAMSTQGVNGSLLTQKIDWLTVGGIVKVGPFSQASKPWPLYFSTLHAPQKALILKDPNHLFAILL